MPAPRKIESAEVLRGKIDEFIAACENGEIDKPTDYRLCNFLGVSPDTLGNWVKNKDDKYTGYAAELKKLELFREHFWLTVADDAKRQTMAIFALKQPKNGGYQDKQEKHIDDIKLDITLNGVKDAFG